MKQTFRNFLEATVDKRDDPTEDLEVDEVLTLLKRHSPTMLKAFLESPLDEDTGKVIYRGSRNHKVNGVYNPASGTRKSQNTTNHYTELFDTNPENSEWPKRSKSFICTTKQSYARGYGSVNVVFPFEEAKIGVVLATDLHAVFINNTTYPFMNRNIVAFAKIVWGNEADNMTYDKLNKLVDDILEKVDARDPALFAKFEEMYLWNEKYNADFQIEYIKKFLNNLRDAFTFDKLKEQFSLCDVHDIASGEFVNNELWFSDKCVLLTYDMAQYLHQNYAEEARVRGANFFKV